jgi:hypothetical protein
MLQPSRLPPSSRATTTRRSLRGERRPLQAELEGREEEHKRRAAAVKKQHEAAERAQKKLLRELGVPDLSPEEITEKARRPSAERP